jgi:hypothetical protein
MRFTISNADSLFMEQNAIDEKYIAAEFNITRISQVLLVFDIKDLITH